MNTDTCPDCSTTPCDCGLPASYTPTPRTDEQAIRPWMDLQNMTTFARQLERELTAAREELAELKEEYGTWWAQKRIAIDELKEVTEQRDEYKAALQSADNHNHEIATKLEIVTEQLAAAREELADWHNAAEQVKAEYPDEVHCSCVAILRKQLKHVTEQRDGLRSAVDYASDKLAAVTEQLKEAREELDKWEQIAHDKLSEVCRQIEKTRVVTEQRDRLADALQKLNEYDLGDIPVGVVRRCEEALQSLNPDHTVEANDMISAAKGGADESQG